MAERISTDERPRARRSANSRLIACLAAIGLSAGAQAEDFSADRAARGRKLALDVCSACHVVAKEQRFPPTLEPPAPDFSTLARRRSLSEAALRRFLASPHGGIGETSKMPDPRLADYQIDALVAYWRKLKTTR